MGVYYIEKKGKNLSCSTDEELLGKPAVYPPEQLHISVIGVRWLPA